MAFSTEDLLKQLNRENERQAHQQQARQQQPQTGQQASQQPQARPQQPQARPQQPQARPQQPQARPQQPQAHPQQPQTRQQQSQARPQQPQAHPQQPQTRQQQPQARQQQQKPQRQKQTATAKKTPAKKPAKAKKQLSKADIWFSKPSHTRLLKLAALVICIVMLVTQVRTGADLEQKTATQRLVHQYNSHQVHTVEVDRFRNTMNEGELAVDPDNDGLTNAEELSGETAVYRPDTADVVLSAGKSTDYTYYNQMLSNAIELDASFIGSVPSKTLVEQYDGNAFETYNVIGKPFILFGFSGKIEINIDRDLKSSRLLVMAEYNEDKDTFTALSYYESFPKGSTRNFSVRSGHPLALLLCDTTSDNLDAYMKKYSPLYSVLSNQLKDKTFDGAVVSRVDRDGDKVMQFYSFDTEQHFSETETERLLSLFAKRTGASANYTAYSTGMMGQFATVSAMNDGHYRAIRWQELPLTFLRPGAGRNRTVSLQTGEDGVPYADLLGYLAGCGEVKKSGVTEKVNKPLDTEKSKTNNPFNTDSHAFLFGNFTTDACPDGVALGMADVVSNYFNYHTLPAVDGVDTEAVAAKFQNGGLAVTDFCERQEAFDSNKVIVPTDEDVISLLEGQTLQNYNTYFAKDQLHSNGWGTIKNVKAYLEAGYTVVAYLRNGSSVTAVVVYKISQSTLTPNEYTLSVYDPNYPKSKVNVVSTLTDEKTLVTMDNQIHIHCKPSNATVDQSGKVKVNYTYTFDYGETAAYCFGNSGLQRNGLLYTGGDIAFKVPKNLQTDQSTSFFTDVERTPEAKK